MIQIFRTDKGRLTPHDKLHAGSWINMESPTDEELSRVRKLVHNLDEFDGFITSLKDPEEQARVETESGALFIVLRVPYTLQKEDDIIYTTRPMGIIRLESYLITISFFEFGILDRLSNQNLDTKRKTSIMLHIFLLSARKFLFQLRHINSKMFTLQSELETYTKNEDLLRLFALERSLVYFNTSLRTDNYVINKLTMMHVVTQYEENKELLEDVLIEFKQAMEMTDTYENIIVSMRDNMESLISNNLTKVMKTLTSLTLILMLPTLVASVYGMNIALPFQRSEHAFLITMGVSVLLSLASIVYLWRKDWF